MSRATLQSTDDLRARQLAQSDPVPTMQNRWTEAVTCAQILIRDLIRELRTIDEKAAQLAEHGITVSVDLGPVGNQAAAARRDLERDTGRTTFELPRGRHESERF